MADYMDLEAEESSDEETQLKHPEKKKARKAKVMDESEEDEDDRMCEDLNDLIDDNPIEESEDEAKKGSKASKKRKKRNNRHFDDRLEDDDYDLLEENLGVAVERKRFKRLRKIKDAESDDEGEQPADERDTIANELFEGGSGDDDERRSVVSHRSQRRGEVATSNEEEENVESDYDDFIVDDNGKSIAAKKPKKKAIYNDAALQEAQDIFGVDFDYGEFGTDNKDSDEEEAEEDGDGERPRRFKKIPKKRPSKKTIFEIYEPSELKRGHFTEVDNEIRETDIPERMQLRSVPVTPVPEGSDELDHEAVWIYKQAFCRAPISIQESHMRDGPQKGPETVEKIKNALGFMRNEHLEVPFILFYRKEYVLPELNINDLWEVYKFDGKWCQLRERKENFLALFDKMRSYQLDELIKNLGVPLPADVRVITDEDVERVKNVETNEELNDLHRHFMLYYGQDIPKMQDQIRRKKREEKRRARAKKRSQQIAEAEENGVEPPPEDEEDEEDVEEADEVLKKQAARTGPYAIYRKAGLDSIAKKFGLSPEHFAENIRHNYKLHEIDQEPMEPKTVALNFCGGIFQTPEEVMKAVQLMVAYQLAREPLLRQCIRELYMERAKLTVRPTTIGITSIDEHHPIYTMKYLKDKPVRDLMGDEYLKLSLAENEKLITMSFSDIIEGHTSSNYIDELKKLYCKDEFTKNVEDWNALRAGSVEMALTKMVIPDLKKELKANLMAESKEYIARDCRRKMHSWIKVAPYTCNISAKDDEEWDTSKGLRIMGLSYVPDYSQAAFACLVKPNGESGEYLRLPHILKRRNSFRQKDRMMKEADLLAIKGFIATHKPHVVALGGESREAIMLAEDVRRCINELVKEESFPEINVEICENDLAKIFSNSNKGKNEFNEYPELLREAISVARRLQNPLVEFSQLCTSDEEILCLKYNFYQDQLPKEELLEIVYVELVNRVNEVGVDLNKAVQMAYWRNLLQFVCGLGPRKGQALIKIMKQMNKRLENRTQLVTDCHMGPKVFVNCAGFIKIDTNSLGDSTEAYVEVLDGSRVHPESYEWARKMAVDALEYDDEDANPAGALEEIVQSPGRLRALDLDAFAEELKRQGFGKKGVTLHDIRAELNCRYKELRVPYQSPTPEKLFSMLTKETPESFFVGKLIMATVTGICRRKPEGEEQNRAAPVRNEATGLWKCPLCLKTDFPELCSVWTHYDDKKCPGKACGVYLRLDNGICGYIHSKNVSDKPVKNLEERVYTGQRIHCRIIKIDMERFGIEGTSKSSDLADKNHKMRPARDPFYDTETKEADSKSWEDQQKMKQRPMYIKRVIVHPAFHNITYADAEKLMKPMKQGESIVRPSSKGENHLTATWKVTDEILHHIDIIETDKENAFSLGKTLTIDNEKFEDLDEIIVRHINPMASSALELLYYKHYKTGVDGCRDKAHNILKELKKKNENGIPYIISASKSRPGKFLLSYMPRTESKHEYISVCPDGFRFRDRTFPRLDGLLFWFKKHFRDPIPNEEAPIVKTPALNGINQDTINKVAQTLPQHVLNSLSQVASTTQNRHPPNTPGSVAVAGSSHTPHMTPYQTPQHAPPPPRHHQQTSNQHHNHQQSQFLVPPPPPHSMGIHYRPTPSYPQPPPIAPAAQREPADWRPTAEFWKAQIQQALFKVS